MLCVIKKQTGDEVTTSSLYKERKIRGCRCNASVLPGMVPWFVILISQLRFRRAHKAAIASHPFRSILFPWANYVTMAFLICVLIGMYFNEDTRMSLFVGIIFMLVVTAIYKVFGLNRHGKAHKLEE